MSWAVTAVVAMFYAVGYWNCWFNVLLFMPADSVRWPLKMVLSDYVAMGMTMPGSGTTGIGSGVGSQQIAPLSLQMAVVALTVVRVIAYPLCIKHFTKGRAARRDQGLAGTGERGRVSGTATHRGLAGRILAGNGGRGAGIRPARGTRR